MSQKSTAVPRTVPLVAIAALAVLAAGCSSGSGAGSATAEPTSDAAREALAAAYAGTTGTPPTEATTPQQGVDAWIISCGQQVPSCATPVAGIVEAAEAVGWTANVCDGQLNPDGWATCVDQATAAGTDVLFPVGIDCASIQEPFEQAAAAGITIVGAGGADCASTGGEQVFATERLQLEGLSIEDYWKRAGATVAQYIIGATDGQAKVVQVNFTSPIWGPWLTEGFSTELESCEDCEIVGTVDVANEDFGSTAAVDKFAAGLQRYADANAVYVPVGGWMSTGFAAAVQASGRSNELVVASGFGDAAAMDLIREGNGLTAALGYATEWGSYGSVDEAIRILNGEEPVVEGDGFQVVDAENNMPASGDYVGGDVDFKAEYLATWGVG